MNFVTAFGAFLASMDDAQKVLGPWLTHAFVSAIEEMVRDLCIKRTDGKVVRNAVLGRLTLTKTMRHME